MSTRQNARRRCLSGWLGSAVVLLCGLIVSTTLADDAPRGKTSSPKKSTGKKSSRNKKGSKGKKSEKNPPKGNAKKPVQIPSDVQKQIDQLMREGPPKGKPASKKPTRKKPGARPTRTRKPTPAKPGRATPQRRVPGRRSPTPTPASARGSEFLRGRRAGIVNKARTPAGSTSTNQGTPINIPASDKTVPPQERMYSFSIKEAPYAVLIEGVARETGLGVIGEAPPDGMVSFITEEQLTFEQLLQRVRMLLFHYKPLEPYWLLRRDTHLEVIRVNDYIRKLDRRYMFRSVEEFHTADVSSEEIVLVLYTPKSGSLADLTVVRDYMPDYVRVTPLEDSNTVAIYALASDIEKYLQMVEVFVTPRGRDPRTLEVIPIHFLPPSIAYDKLQALMGLGSGNVPARPRSSLRGRGAAANSLDAVPEPEVSVVPDDVRKVLIVRAMRDKIEEIKTLLPYVDVDTKRQYLPVVIEVKHADPETLIDTVRQVIRSGEPSTSSSSSPSVTSRGRRTTASTRKRSGVQGVAAITADHITMISHPAGHAIIVMASEEDVARVRRLVELFDVAITVPPVRIAIEHVDPAAIVATVTQLLAGGASTTRGLKTISQDRASVVADPGGKAIWYSGSARDLERVRALIAEMDREEEAASLHIVRLENQQPSFVAAILGEFDGGGGFKPVTAGPRGRKPGRGKLRRTGRSGSASKFTPDDEQRRLFVLCTEAEWQRYKPIIDNLEREEIHEDFHLVAVHHIPVGEAIEKLSSMLGASSGPSGKGPAAATTGLRLEATEGGMIVMGATSSDMKTIRSLLAEFDKPSNIEQRTFVIVHADPLELQAALETLFGGQGKGHAAKPGRPMRGRPGKPAGTSALPDLTIVPLEHNLIVKATPEVMEQVAEFIEEFDVDRDKTEVRVYDDFPPGADMDAIVESLQTMMGMTSPVGGRGKVKRPTPGDAEKAAPRLIPQPAQNRLIVVAEPSQFERIENFLEVLRKDIEVPEVIVAFIPLEHGDAEKIVESIEPVLAMKVERLIREGAVGESASEGAATGRPTRPGIRPGKKQTSQSEPYHLAADAPNKRIVIAAERAVVEEARALIASFDVEGEGVAPIEVAFVQIAHADPEELVEAIDPILTMKAEELIAEGKLVVKSDVASQGAGRKKGRPRPVRGGLAKTPGGTGGVYYHLTADVRQRQLVIAAPALIIEEARKLVADFDKPGSAGDSVEIAYIPVKNASAVDLVEQIDPLLTMKVRQLVRDGVLASGEGAVAAPSTANKPKSRLQRKGRSAPGEEKRYHLEADERNHQIVVAAPHAVIEEARKLIGDLDQPGSTGDVFETVVLENADPAEMVETIQAMIGQPKKRKSVRGKGNSRAAEGREASEHPFTIVVAPGGGAVVLRGGTEDVARAKEWITHLDAMAHSGRIVKSYSIQHADVPQLVELIMNVVGVEEKKKTPRGKRPRLGRAAADLEEEEETEAFVTELTRSGPDIYLRADLIDNTIVVATTPAKHAVVAELVAQFDDEEQVAAKPVLPKMVYPLEYAEASDAAFNLEAVLTALWDPSNKLPEVDYASFDNLLVVRYPDKDRFPEISDLIAKYVDKPPDETKFKRKALAVPTGMSAKDLALWLQLNHPEMDIELIDISEKQDEVYGVEQVVPQEVAASPCVLPAAFVRLASGLVAGVAGESAAAGVEKEGEAFEEGAEADPPPHPKRRRSDPVDDLVRAKAKSLLDEGKDKSSPASSSDKKNGKRKKRVGRKGGRLKVYYDQTKGNVVVEGSEAVIGDIPDWIDDLKEEIKELNLVPDIRTYRVKYIDVYAAERIINEMFNATRQQQAQVRQQQRFRLQQQQRQQRRQQPQGRGQQPGQPGRPGQRNQGILPGTTQLPPTAVRVFANPRDRTLILRADPHQFPAILKLLATIDQPRPITSKHRIYHLKKLNASSVEAILEDWLGLHEAAPRRQAQTGNRRRGGASSSAGGATASSSQLPETLVQPIQGGVGGLGVDPRDIKLSSNVENNTILAMAPPVALDYIGRLIDDLESQGVSDRIWENFQLTYARTEDVVDFLTGRFATKEPSSPKRKGKGRKGGSSTVLASSLNTPTFVSYPRLSMISAQATSEQMTEIREEVKRLDVPGDDEQYQFITLVHADAKVVADTLAAMFGEAGSPATKSFSRKGGRKRSSTTQTPGVRFIGEEGGRVVFYRAPTHQREKILAVVKKLEAQSAASSKLHVMQLVHAKPSLVAEQVEMAYGAGRRTAGRGGRGGGSTGPAVTVTGNDPTKQLFVMADDATFSEIESLVKSLDRETEMGFDFRIYPLQYADAKRVHAIMTKLVTNYLRMLPRDSKTEAFSVEPDEKANALVVLGGPIVFDFVERSIALVDTPANARSPLTTMMVPLRVADAKEVAQMINQLWAQRKGSIDEEPPQAQANVSLNTVIVRGTQDQMDEIREDIIAPLENQSNQQLTTETISLRYAKADDVAQTITQVYEDKRRVFQEVKGRGPSISPLETAVVVTPDTATNQLIIQASESNMKTIKERIVLLDREDIARRNLLTTKTYALKYADPSAVAGILQNISQAKTGGKKKTVPRDVILAVAEPGTQTVVVTASETNHARVREVVDDLDKNNTLGQVKTIKLTYADPGVVQGAIDMLFAKKGRTPRDQVTAVPDWDSRSIIVSASQGNLARIEELIAQLDNEDVSQRKVHVINLQNTDADSVAQTLTEVFIRSQSRRQGDGSQPISISALKGSRAIMVSSGADDYARISEAVAAIDKEEAVVGEEVRVVTLLYTDAGEMHAALQEYLKKPGGAGGRGGTAELVGDTRVSLLAQSNALVISGEKQRVQRLESLAKQLDEAGEKGSIPQIITLQYAKVGQIISSVTDMFGEQRGGGRGQAPPVIVANDAINGLLVRAGPTDMAAIEGVIAKLDTPDIKLADPFKLIRVGPGVNVTDLAAMIERSMNAGLAQTASKGNGRQTPTVSIEPDKRTRTLLVSGPPNYFDDVEKMVRAYEKMGPSSGETIRIIKLGKTPSAEVMALIEQLKGESSGRTSARRGGGGSRRRSSAGRSNRGSSRPRGSSGGRRGSRRNAPQRPRTNRPRTNRPR